MASIKLPLNAKEEEDNTTTFSTTGGWILQVLYDEGDAEDSQPRSSVGGHDKSLNSLGLQLRLCCQVLVFSLSCVFGPGHESVQILTVFLIC